MTTQTDRFSTALAIGTGVTDITTTAAAERKIIWSLTFTNTSASAVLVTLYSILTAGTETSGSGGNWVDQRTIQPGKVWSPLATLGTMVMDPSETLSATAGTGAVIMCNCGGSVET